MIIVPTVYLFVACREVISGQVIELEGGRIPLIWQGFILLECVLGVESSARAPKTTREGACAPRCRSSLCPLLFLTNHTMNPQFQLRIHGSSGSLAENLAEQRIERVTRWC